jgi:hypothetical protein
MCCAALDPACSLKLFIDRPWTSRSIFDRDIVLPRRSFCWKIVTSFDPAISYRHTGETGTTSHELILTSEEQLPEAKSSG